MATQTPTISQMETITKASKMLITLNEVIDYTEDLVAFNKEDHWVLADLENTLEIYLYDIYSQNDEDFAEAMSMLEMQIPKSQFVAKMAAKYLEEK